MGASPGNLTVGGNHAVLGAGDADSCDLHAVRTTDNSAVHDSATPLTLAATSGSCTVDKIETGLTSSGWKAYVPAGAWGAENALFQVSLATVTAEDSFDLAPAANLPAAVGLLYLTEPTTWREQLLPHTPSFTNRGVGSPSTPWKAASSASFRTDPQGALAWLSHPPFAQSHPAFS